MNRSGLERIRDPELPAVQNDSDRPCPTARHASAKASLPEPASDKGVSADQVLREPRQILALLLLVGPAHDGIVHQRVLHVDENAERRVDPRDLLDRKHRHEEAAVRPRRIPPGCECPSVRVRTIRGMNARSSFASSSILRTSGLIRSSANDRQESRNSCSSSERTVKGMCEAITSSTPGKSANYIQPSVHGQQRARHPAKVVGMTPSLSRQRKSAMGFSRVARLSYRL